MTFVYPTTTFDNPEIYTKLVGGFWSSIYGGSSFIQNLLQARAQLEQQTLQNQNEWLATIDRHTVPPYHTVNWFQVILAESNRSQLDSGAYAFTAPDSLISAAAIADAITTPARLLLPGTDFYIDAPNIEIVFMSDPFQDPYLPVVSSPSDNTITLWLCRPNFDLGYAQTYVGSLLFPVAPPTSEGFLAAVNAVLDAAVGNTAFEQVTRLLAALNGCPICQIQGETVKALITWAGQLQIITDSNVYSFSDAATPAVAVGNVLNRDQQLINEVKVFECGGTSVPSGLASVILPAGFLAPSLGPLTFSNVITPLIVTENVYGYTRVEWLMGGANVDIINFFTLLHAKGITAVTAALLKGDFAGSPIKFAGSETEYAGSEFLPANSGKTLAMLMDLRGFGAEFGQPTAASLPATINPLQFLLANVLRAGCIVVQMQAAVIGPNALGMAYSGLFRQIVPPHVGLILSID